MNANSTICLRPISLSLSLSLPKLSHEKRYNKEQFMKQDKSVQPMPMLQDEATEAATKTQIPNDQLNQKPRPACLEPLASPKLKSESELGCQFWRTSDIPFPIYPPVPSDAKNIPVGALNACPHCPETQM